MKLIISHIRLIVMSFAFGLLWGGGILASSYRVNAAPAHSLVSTTAIGDRLTVTPAVGVQLPPSSSAQFVSPTSDQWALQLVSAEGDASTGEVVVTIGIQPLKGQQGAGFRLMQVVGAGGETLLPDLCWNHGSISQSLTAGVFTPYTLQSIRVPKTMQSLEVLKFKLSSIEGYEARNIPIHWVGSWVGTSDPASNTPVASLSDQPTEGDPGDQGGVVAPQPTPNDNTPKPDPKSDPKSDLKSDSKSVPDPVRHAPDEEKERAANTPPVAEDRTLPKSDDRSSDEDHLLPVEPIEEVGYYCGGKDGCPGHLLIYLGQDGHMERLFKAKQPYYGYVAIGGVYNGETVTYAPDPFFPMPITAIYKKGDHIAIECASFGALWNDECGRSMGTDEDGNCKNGLFRFILSKDDAKITVANTDFYNDQIGRWVKFVPNNGAGSIDLIGFDMCGFVLDYHTDRMPIDWPVLEGSMASFDARLQKKGLYYKGLNMRKATSNPRYHNDGR